MQGKKHIGYLSNIKMNSYATRVVVESFENVIPAKNLNRLELKSRTVNYLNRCNSIFSFSKAKYKLANIVG